MRGQHPGQRQHHDAGRYRDEDGAPGVLTSGVRRRSQAEGRRPSRPVPVLGGSHSVTRVHEPHDPQCDGTARGGVGNHLRNDERRTGHCQQGGGEYRAVGRGIGVVGLLQSKQPCTGTGSQEQALEDQDESLPHQARDGAGSRGAEQLGAPQVLLSACQRHRAQGYDDAQHQTGEPSELPGCHLDNTRGIGEPAVEKGRGVGDLGRGHGPGQVFR